MLGLTTSLYTVNTRKFPSFLYTLKNFKNPCLILILIQLIN